MTFARASAALLAVVFTAGCQQVEEITRRQVAQNSGPEIIVPPDVQSSTTAALVEAQMLIWIEANEERLGRSLAPVRIVRIQLLRDGEVYQFKHLDGTNPHEIVVSPGPGWIVEAVGTFVDVDPITGQIDSLGTHGFRLWQDPGGEQWGFTRCWTRQGVPPEYMEGTCRP